MSIVEKGKESKLKSHDNLPPIRPYLSGSISGLEFQDNEGFFQKEVPIGDISPTTAMRW